MVPVSLGVPNQVIENVRDILHGPIVAGIRIGEKVMAERLQNEQRTLDKRIVPGQIKIVPEKLPWECRNVNAGAEQSE
jgi:hypothetical protein